MDVTCTCPVRGGDSHQVANCSPGCGIKQHRIKTLRVLNRVCNRFRELIPSIDKLILVKYLAMFVFPTSTILQIPDVELILTSPESPSLILCSRATANFAPLLSPIVLVNQFEITLQQNRGRRVKFPLRMSLLISPP